MRFRKAKNLERRAHSRKGIAMLCSIFFLFFALHSLPYAGIKDRIVASVDNTAITLSDLEKKYADTVKLTPNITKDEVLNTMINRVLLLREAKKIRLEAPSEDEMIKEYIDLKIRTFIRIKEEEARDFYSKHVTNFEGKEFEEVREDIENYLTENELNQLLKSHINELRGNVCVKIQLHQEVQK